MYVSYIKILFFEQFETYLYDFGTIFTFTFMHLADAFIEHD